MNDIKRCCRITGVPFQVNAAEQAHIERLGRFLKVVGEPLPLPSIHPYEQLRQILAYANQTHLSRSKSAFSGKPQLTRYNPAHGYRICTTEEFWGLEVDNLEFGRDYDFGRPFMAQWNDLMHRIYLPPLNVTNIENSDYVNSANNVKNCFLCFTLVECQDLLYCMNIFRSNDCIYCVGGNRSQYCYDAVDFENCYQCQHIQDCTDCSSCFGSLDLIGCHDCIGCVGLRNNRYCVFNEKLPQHEYETFLETCRVGNRLSRKALLLRCSDFIASRHHSVQRIRNSENCTGCYINNGRNLENCYHTSNSEDCAYIMLANRSRDCWKGYAISSELTYMSGGVGAKNLYCSVGIWDGLNCLYSMLLFNHCCDCFGCAGLLGKSYCILNKQYSQQEYFDLVPRIISHMKVTGEWGEFFPACYSPLLYEESTAEEWMEPLPAAEIRRRGYRIGSLTEIEQAAAEIHGRELPADADDINVNELACKTIACVETGRPFRFQKRELEFYLREKIPVPNNYWWNHLHELLMKRELIPAV